jgi:hypothetical protein
MGEAGNSQEHDIDSSQNLHVGRLGRLPKRVLVAAAYYAAVIVALLLSHWAIFKFEASSLIILIAIIAPFIVDRLSSIEYGGVKVQLNELKHEFRGTTDKIAHEVSKTRDELNSKLEQLARQSREYLLPQSLELADAKASEIRDKVNIGPEEVELLLASTDPNQRIIAYFQIQNRPEPRHLESLAECFFIEGFLATKQKETRPLWQLLVAVHSVSRDLGDLNFVAKHKVHIGMHYILDWLEADPSVDRGGQCKARLRLLIPIFNDARPQLWSLLAVAAASGAPSILFTINSYDG